MVPLAEKENKYATVFPMGKFDPNLLYSPPSGMMS